MSDYSNPRKFPWANPAMASKFHPGAVWAPPGTPLRWPVMAPGRVIISNYTEYTGHKVVWCSCRKNGQIIWSRCGVAAVEENAARIHGLVYIGTLDIDPVVEMEAELLSEIEADLPRVEESESKLERRSEMVSQYYDQDDQGVEITPEVAKAFLAKRAPYQRPVSRALVREYVDMMRAGKWVLNGDSITFDTDGYMFNGNHRCEAVVASGVTIRCHVSGNYPPDTYKRTDRGAKRSAGDDVYGEGFRISRNQVAALAAKIHTYRRYEGQLFLYQNFTATGDERVAVLKELRREGVDPVAICRRVNRDELRQYGNAGARTFCYWMFSTIAPDDAERFFNGVGTGVGLPLGNPALAVRSWFTSASKRREIPMVMAIAIYIKGWNAFRTGRSIRNLVWNDNAGERFPRPM